MTMLQPQLLWAQRKDKLYLTVDLQDCESPDVKLTNEDGVGKFDFKGTAKGSQYELTCQLYAEIDPDDVQIANTARHVFLMVPKKEEGDHWPRLTKEKAKHNHIQVDWAKYIDQDDEEAGEDSFAPEGMQGLEGMGGGMGGMGGGGMPGMEGMGGGMPGGMGGMGGPGNMDMAQLQQMMAQAGAGGAGGAGPSADMGEDDDSDDDDLPDLEG